MAITNAGITYIATAINGEAFTAFNNSNCYIGVGDGTTAFVATQTDLQASTNKLRKGMDVTYPNRSGAAITSRATFGLSEANFSWEEWGVFNALSGGTMMNRVVEFLGAKTNVQTWQLTATLTFAAA